MADTFTSKDTLAVALTLQRGTESASRTFSIDNPNWDRSSEESTAAYKTALANLKTFLLGEGKTLIQPTSWRDSDAAEEEWETVGVSFKTTFADIIEFENSKLSRNAQLKNAGSTEVITSISAATLPVYTSQFTSFKLHYDGMTNADTVFIAYQKLDPTKGDLYFDWWSSPDATAGNMEIAIAKGDVEDDDYTGTLIIYLPETDAYAEQYLRIPITN